MDIVQLSKPDLLLIWDELEIDVRKSHGNQLLVKAIKATGADEKEILECWEFIAE